MNKLSSIFTVIKIYYDDGNLSERFPLKIERKREALKSIVKGNFKFMVHCVHNINKKLKSCNGFGQFNDKEKIQIFTQKPDFKYYYIDHYCFKSTEEFIIKLNRGSAFYGKENQTKINKIKWYFNVNNITSKKIDYIERYAHINLDKYRNEIS